jgi:hypothetical protein
LLDPRLVMRYRDKKVVGDNVRFSCAASATERIIRSR